MEITLLGRQYTLTKPKGRRGMKIMSDLQTAYQRTLNLLAESGIIDADEESLASIGDGGRKITSATVKLSASAMGALNSAVLTEDFLNKVVVPLMMSSTEKLTKSQALKRIENFTFEGGVADELFVAHKQAMDFWSGTADDPEALEEALKKSEAAVKEAASE